MTLKFGWWDHFEQNSDIPPWRQYDERIALIQYAKEHGFGGYYIADHHFMTLDIAPSPIVFLAAWRGRRRRSGWHHGALPAAVSSDPPGSWSTSSRTGRFMPGGCGAIREPAQRREHRGLSHTPENVGASRIGASAGCQAGSPGESARPGGQPGRLGWSNGPASGMGRVSRVASCAASVVAVSVSPNAPLRPQPPDRNSVHRRLLPPGAQGPIVCALRSSFFKWPSGNRRDEGHGV
jgi:hypothetical protein